MRRFKAQLVTPWQITSRNWKGFTTPKKVMDFAKKSHVPCGWYMDPYSKKRTPLVDWTTWQKAWKYWKRTGEYWYGLEQKKVQARKPQVIKAVAQRPVWRKSPRKVVKMWSGRKQYRRKAA
jgi:hypothetical protein